MGTRLSYKAPETETVMVSIAGPCLTTLSETAGALGNSSTEDATDYNDGNEISW